MQKKTKMSPQAAREASRRYTANKRAAESDIGEIPEPVNLIRRNSCENDLLLFIKTYRFGFDKTYFTGKLFPDQIKQIHDIERAFKTRGCYAFANFRGAGKSSILNSFRAWAIFYGHSKWLITINASQDAIKNQMASFKNEIMNNELIKEDFPEIHYPFKLVNADGRRVKAQTCEYVPTSFVLEPNKIVMPDVSSSAYWQQCAGSVVESTSPATAGLRGKNLEGVRPDTVVLDDVESDDSVKSEAKTAQIEDMLTTIAGLGSHFQDVRCIWIGTIIKENCLMAQYSDMNKKPSWNGKRFCYMPKMPDNEDLWQEYMKIRKNRALGDIPASREYYREHREEMDKGCVVSWPEGFDPVKYDSSIEKFYASWADKSRKFMACELQNNPGLLQTEEDKKQLDQTELSKRLNGYAQGVIPTQAAGLAGFIDMQDPNASPLYWLISWFNGSFGGGLYKYGTWPLDGTSQREYYERKINKPLNKDDILAYSLQDCIAYLNKPEYKRENGSKIQLQLGCDSGAGQHQITVFDKARQNKYQNLIPTKGVGLKAQVLGSGKSTKLIRKGLEWYTNYQQDSNSTMMEVLSYESRRWKCFVRDRLQSPMSAITSWSFYGFDDAEFIELYKHFTAERSKECYTPENQKYIIWDELGENHYWDCLVGCHVVASARLGITLKIDGVDKIEPKKFVPYTINITPM